MVDSKSEEKSIPLGHEQSGCLMPRIDNGISNPYIGLELGDT